MKATLRLLLPLALAAASASADWRFGVADFSTSEPLKNAGTIIAAGYDYIEPGLAKAVALPPEELDAARARLQAARIPVAAMNWFVPGTVKLTGPDADPAKIRAYAEKALSVAHSLGARAIVFGSPAARTVPEGFSMEKARAQLADFCRTCADIIEKNNFPIRIGIEHLNKGETNILNTLADATRLAREVNRPAIGVTVDLYHLAVENEPLDAILEARELVVHAQLADPAGRAFPTTPAAEERIAQFLQRLRTIGYQGGISIEANVADLEPDCRASLPLLKRAAAAAAH